MIYTVTFNPALDYVVHMDKELSIGSVNRSSAEEFYYGGKGINVSTVLKNLGIDSVALGFVSGFTGAAIENGLRQMGISTDFIHLQNGISRINVKIKSKDETEINCQGPTIEDFERVQLFVKLHALHEGDILVLAGSIPNTLPVDVYESILSSIEGKNVLVVVDATKELLLKVLKYHPFLIKPNNHELGELFGIVLKTDEEIITYAKKLQSQGARNVLVSMAKDGAILITEDGKSIKIGVPKGTVRNSVGAGDSMVAGFIAGYLDSGDYNVALKMGTAAGSATAFSDGLATKDKVTELFSNL